MARMGLRSALRPGAGGHARLLRGHLVARRRSLGWLSERPRSLHSSRWRALSVPASRTAEHDRAEQLRVAAHRLARLQRAEDRWLLGTAIDFHHQCWIHRSPGARRSACVGWHWKSMAQCSTPLGRVDIPCMPLDDSRLAGHVESSAADGPSRRIEFGRIIPLIGRRGDQRPA